MAGRQREMMLIAVRQGERTGRTVIGIGQVTKIAMIYSGPVLTWDVPDPTGRVYASKQFLPYGQQPLVCPD